MVYRAIGLMSGSSLDGLDVVFAELEETRGNWTYNIQASACYQYTEEWRNKLKNATTLSAYDYLLLDVEFAKLIVENINHFIEGNNLFHRVQIIASHGHTVFHAPTKGMTAQLGDAATIAALTGINVVSHLRNIDVALGGQGAPIVPVGEKLLFNQYRYFLNIGGIANVSANADEYTAFDICPANAVLNRIAGLQNNLFDENGAAASLGSIGHNLLDALNALPYYKEAAPKSLANTFGQQIFELVQSYNLGYNDALRTYTAHIALQVFNAVETLQEKNNKDRAQILVTGGGALNSFLVEKIQDLLQHINVEVVVPDETTVNYKEALIMGLLGILRWREQNTTIDTVTGASRSSIGGAVWIGQEA